MDDAPLGGREAAPSVRVLLDPEDDVAVTASLLKLHDPGRGVVVVHPTPASQSAGGLAHDVLAALGRPVHALEADKVSAVGPAWRAAAAWMRADAVGDLVVLRADRIALAAWPHLLGRAKTPGLRLLLVCHTRTFPRVLSKALDAAEVGHQVLPSLDAATTLLGTRLEPDRPPDAVAVDGGLPTVNRPQLTFYRAEAFRRLPTSSFARFDAVYTAGLDEACRWLSAHPDRVQAWVDDLAARKKQMFWREFTAAPPGGPLGGAWPYCAGRADGRPSRQEPLGRLGHREELQLFLTGLVHSCAARRHALARLRGAQAGFLLHGLLLQLPTDLQRLGGPGLTSLPVTAEITDRLRARTANPVHAASVAAARFTGLDAKPLSRIPISALSAQADTLRIPLPRSQRHWSAPSWEGIEAASHDLTIAIFHVPATARPLLHAARQFLLERGNPPSRLLLTMNGYRPGELHQRATGYGMDLPAKPVQLDSLWQNVAGCVPVGDPIHTEPTSRHLFALRPHLTSGTIDHYSAYPVDHHRPLTASGAARTLRAVHAHLHAQAGADSDAVSPSDPQLGDLLFALRLADQPTIDG